MTHEDLHNAIRSRMDAQVAVPESVAVQYDNEGEAPPSDAVWIRCAVQVGRSEQADMGSTTVRERTVGVVMAQVFCPADEGDQPGLEMADKIKAAFRRVTAGGVTYRVPSIEPQGRDGKWWQINVTVPFYSDDVS